MKNHIPETITNSSLLLLLGFCIGIVATENRFPISDIANMTLATVAILGYFSWKRGIDYQERKNDRKTLIRIIKNLESATDEILKKSGFPLKLIQEAKENKKELNEFQRALIKKDIGDIEQKTDKLRAIQAELESESSASRLVQESETLAANIANLIIQNRQIANIADSIAFSQNPVDIDAPIEAFADQSDTLTRFTETYQPYYILNASIEVELGAFEATKKKEEIYRNHYQQTK